MSRVKTSTLLVVGLMLHACVQTTGRQDVGATSDVSDAADAVLDAVVADGPDGQTLRIFTPVDREFAYGAASSHLLGSTSPHEGPATILLWLWEDPGGCGVLRTGVDPVEVVNIGIHVRGAAIDATRDLPPTVGTYPVAPVAPAGHTLAPGESDIYFAYVRDGVFVGNLYGESGTLTIEAVSTTEITIFVDATLTGGVPIRGRATIGLCLP